VRRKASAHASAYDGGGGAGFIAPRLVVVAALIAAAASAVGGLWRGDHPAGAALASAPTRFPSTGTPVPAVVALLPSATPMPTETLPPTALPTPLPTFTPAKPLPHVLIVAGHWGSDSGAVCPDGLQEVDINLSVAQRVCSLLESRGYHAELMKEFDPRMEGYYALALVSIHSDSCEPFPNAVPPASGFKVASVVRGESLVPADEERLVNCLSQNYGARTGLPLHSTSITEDMLRYHAFYSVDARTPAAIIEIGFMYNDRRILTEQPDLLAQGIVDGITCFLQGEQVR
jgi:N-acetylmuramoyl-L-alanine amidase